VLVGGLQLVGALPGHLVGWLLTVTHPHPKTLPLCPSAMRHAKAMQSGVADWGPPPSRHFQVLKT
jgi:hypothetical protein